MINIVHNCDCMKFMKDCKDNEFDLAIVDPPYGIGEDGGDKKRSRKYNKIVLHKKKNWDERPSKKYFNDLFRISKNQIIFGANYFIDKIDTISMGWVFWDKKIGGDYSDGELIFTSFWRALRKISISYHNGTRGGHNRIHPTQKPIALYKWILKNYAKPGWIIFDSHVGSGSLRIACYDMGFDFVGCELDPDYWQAQEERFKNYTANRELWDKGEIQEHIYR